MDDPRLLDFSIVIPAYNEARAIGNTLRRVTTHLAALKWKSEIIVVDDGSDDETASIVQRFMSAERAVRLFRNTKNQGKGASVKRGVLAAEGRYIFFMDADLSVPVEEIDGAFDAIARDDLPILIGSRRVGGAAIEVRQPVARELMGRGFTWLGRIVLCPDILDFTCGFKGFRRAEARQLFSALRRNDWAFDAEILYRARLQNVPVSQYPIRWRHHEGSRVRFPRDAWRSLSALFEIRLRTSQQSHTLVTGFELLDENGIPQE